MISIRPERQEEDQVFMNINKHTGRLTDLAAEIAGAAKENNKVYFIGGGFAIDFFCGKVSRNHHDIDFHPMLEDAAWWIDWFNNQGYKVINRSDPKFPETWWIYGSEEEFMVDMWPFRLDHGALFINQDGTYIDAGRHWDETTFVHFHNADIRVENPHRVLEQKTRQTGPGQKHRPVDVHDFKLLGKDPK
jgi:hypothetical protein